MASFTNYFTSTARPTAPAFGETRTDNVCRAVQVGTVIDYSMLASFKSSRAKRRRKTRYCEASLGNVKHSHAP